VRPGQQLAHRRTVLRQDLRQEQPQSQHRGVGHELFKQVFRQFHTGRGHGLETKALLGVSLHEADQGDTQTVVNSVEAAFTQVSGAIEATVAELPEGLFEEVVTDKGYRG